jgi:hypothetical protein
VSVSIIETLVVFVGIPVVVIAIAFGIGFSVGANRARRYRPGRPFEFTPVWFLSSPEQLSGAAEQRAIAAGADSRAVTSTDRPALTKADQRGGDLVTAEVTAQDATGGASDRW